jgi:SAM-dependent methyltransferase
MSINSYWENRLQKDFSLSSVGYIGLGKSFNNWMYKVRRKVFIRLTKKYVDPSIAYSVLDIGCGTGFYIDRWLELGAKNISGIDITRISVENLSKKYPTLSFFQLDISDNNLPFNAKTFDYISAFDVLFHIVDDNNFISALNNINYLLKPNGIFIFSDNFLHGNEIITKSQACRKISKIEAALKNTGFEICERVPMFYFMNDPCDSNNKFLISFWRFLIKILLHSDFIGFVLGSILYPIDIFLTSKIKEGPSTEIMVCRKKT